MKSLPLVRESTVGACSTKETHWPCRRQTFLLGERPTMLFLYQWHRKRLLPPPLSLRYPLVPLPSRSPMRTEQRYGSTQNRRIGAEALHDLAASASIHRAPPSRR